MKAMVINMKIKINNLSKRFDENKVVLKNINLKEECGTLALIGRSGCGKSTLLRMMGGLISPSQGEVFLNQEKAIEHEEYRKKIGFVFQQGGLFRHLTGKENITLPLVKVHGLSVEEADKRAEELLARFGLEKESYKKPAQLSGGQQQRIAIARAVAPRPEILLLDEPTSALDPEYTNEVLDMIEELKNDGVSFVIATHEMGFARHACEKVAFLHEGNILEFDDSEKIFQEPKTKELKQFLDKLLEWK